jgi:hypothetical protein
MLLGCNFFEIKFTSIYYSYFVILRYAQDDKAEEDCHTEPVEVRSVEAHPPCFDRLSMTISEPNTLLIQLNQPLPLCNN